MALATEIPVDNYTVLSSDTMAGAVIAPPGLRVIVQNATSAQAVLPLVGWSARNNPLFVHPATGRLATLRGWDVIDVMRD